ncbi:GPW/gp25 family protein [Aquincola tertiaricarbonis]|uniref:GPW/gp25 family protein n=1 Tax=Aquincola tertiaricarbonis TaxID=391953 RepID=UPI000614FED4|nr:GPW/gp25 family protein [Aquincola tertiaricarbonis]
MNIAYPLQFDARGRTAAADDARHVRDLIEQLLFTAPGERVMRPTLGSGLLQMVFAPASDALASTLRASTQAALQQWLGDRLTVDDVTAVADEATLRVEVRYRLLLTGESRVEAFERALP